MNVGTLYHVYDKEDESAEADKISIEDLDSTQASLEDGDKIVAVVQSEGGTLLNDIGENKSSKLIRLSESLDPALISDIMDTIRNTVGDGRSYSAYRLSLFDLEDSSLPVTVIHPKNYSISEIRKSINSITNKSTTSEIDENTNPLKPSSVTYLNSGNIRAYCQLSDRMYVITDKNSIEKRLS